jgi:hypothetical protein
LLSRGDDGRGLQQDNVLGVAGNRQPAVTQQMFQSVARRQGGMQGRAAPRRGISVRIEQLHPGLMRELIERGGQGLRGNVETARRIGRTGFHRHGERHDRGRHRRGKKEAPNRVHARSLPFMHDSFMSSGQDQAPRAR